MIETAGVTANHPMFDSHAIAQAKASAEMKM